MTNTHDSPLATDQWYTPPALVRGIARYLGVTIGLDPAATSESARADRFYTHTDDGLAQDWVADCPPGAAVWLNPPYSSPGPWVAKADKTAADGVTVVALLRASTDTRWWHAHCSNAARLLLLGGRVRYLRPGGTSPGPANHASIVVVWQPERSCTSSVEHVMTADLLAAGEADGLVLAS